MSSATRSPAAAAPASRSKFRPPGTPRWRLGDHAQEVIVRAPYPDFGPPLTLRVEVRRLNLWLQPFRLAEAVHRPSQLSEVCFFSDRRRTPPLQAGRWSAPGRIAQPRRAAGGCPPGGAPGPSPGAVAGRARPRCGPETVGIPAAAVSVHLLPAAAGTDAGAVRWQLGGPKAQTGRETSAQVP